MKIPPRYVLIVTLTGLCLLNWFLAPSSFGQTEKVTIFFYSSESNINNFKSLKMEFDRYLAQFGDYEFQPFSERQTFEQQIEEKKNCLVLLSSWHYDNIREAFRLTPLLVGSRKGTTYQKHLLIAGSEGLSLEALKDGQIASSGSLQYSRTLLKDMLQTPETVEELRILTVPKDIDALMSLGFGMAKAAISTDYSLETLAKMNPVLHKKLSILAESRESRLLILAVPEECKGKAVQLAASFRKMADDGEGRKKLRMLGLDAWEIFDASDATDLEN